MSSPVLYVSDVDRSMAFYVENMGAMPGGNIADAHGKSICGEVRFGDTRVSVRAAPLRNQSRYPVEHRIDLGPDASIEQLYAEMYLYGVNVHDELSDDAWGNRMFCVEDPDGYRWRFVRPAYAVVGDRLLTTSSGGM